MIVEIQSYGVIYTLINNLNGKKYIGQTKNIQRRINEYRTRKVSSSKKYNYLIIRVINDIGFNNFTIEIIDMAFSKKELSYKEKYYITYFKTTDSMFGYNSRNGNLKEGLNENTKKLMSASHIGLTETADTKRKKSKKVIAFKNNLCYICDNGKLFADFISRNKDNVSHAILRALCISGWYVFYLNNIYIDKSDLYEKRKDKKYLELYRLVERGVETIQSSYIIEYIRYE